MSRRCRKPGFKVMHIQDIDFRSSCPHLCRGPEGSCATGRSLTPTTRRSCITMNTTDGSARVPGGVDGLPFDDAAYDALDAEIVSVFPRRRSDHPGRSCAAAIRPCARRARTRLAHAGRGARQDPLRARRVRPPSRRLSRRAQVLRGPHVFVNTDEDAADSAYLTLNEYADVPRITAAVKAGFIVRTRADAETVEASANDTTPPRRRLCSRRAVCLHRLSPAGPALLRLSGAAARRWIAVANPQRAPERCAGVAIEP